jgi:hypothetical protein
VEKGIIREHLHSIAKQEISNNLDLWPSILETLKPNHARSRPVGKLFVRVLITSFLFISILAVSIKTIPPLRVFSMNLILSFSRAISDTLEIEFRVLDPLVMLIAEEGDYYAESIEVASSRAGFNILEPEVLPDGYSLETILAMKGVPHVSLWYKNSENYGSIHITEYQQGVASKFVTVCQNMEVRSVSTLDVTGIIWMEEPEVLSAAESQDCDELRSIGNSAEIQSIPINGMLVEYVQGDWVIPWTERAQDDVTPGETRIYSYIWDPDYHRHHFRWESIGLVIDVDTRDRQLSLEDYIILIESMH